MRIIVKPIKPGIDKLSAAEVKICSGDNANLSCPRLKEITVTTGCGCATSNSE